MKYVDMNEVVFVSGRLAFPGLGNCHGVVYVNQVGMFGYHAAGNPLDSEGKADAFGSFVKTHNRGGAAGVCLYGACPTNRHGKDKDHKAELKMIAKAIGFDGPLRGYRWNMAQLGWGTTYVEFRFQQMAVSIFIEDFSNGTAQAGNNAKWQDHKYVSQVKVLSNPLDNNSPQQMTSKITVRSTVTTAVTRHGAAQQVQAWKL